MADRLEDLLRDCTVHVTGGPGPGAGFFVAPGKVLTCVHVTGEGGDELQVRWERDGRPARVASVLPRITLLADRGRPIPALAADYPDIAVLSVPGLDGHPCVDIETDWPGAGDTFLVFGYPQEGGAIRLTPARLSYRGSNGTLPTAYLDLASDTIKPGMSGAAVLNVRTGAVCGVIVASKNAAHPDGALAIPWMTVAGDLAEVLTANREFQRTDPRWRDAFRDSRAAAGAAAVAPAARRARIASYLTAARSVAREHPYTIKLAEGAAPPLSTVYLRQQLGVQGDQPQPAAADSGAPSPSPRRGGGPTQVRDPATGITVDTIKEALQRFDVEELLKNNDGGLILGGAGSGKSSLMRHLVEVAAGGWLADTPTGFVPVLVPAQVLLGSLPINEAIAAALKPDFGTRLDDSDLASLFAARPVPDLPWLVLLDGLDEIFEPERRQQVIDIVLRWWSDPRYRFLITSRPLPERELALLRTAGVPTFEIQAFSDDQLPELARRWFQALAVPGADELVARFTEQVRRTQMAYLTRNPLLATISCAVFADNPDRELPYSRADLYRAYTALLLAKVSAAEKFLTSISERLIRYGHDSPAGATALAAGLPGLIQDLAVARLTGATDSLRARAGELAAGYRPPAVPDDEWQQVVREMLLQSGLLSERAGDLGFAHETIAEFLAARARTLGPGASRLGARERWLLRAQAGDGESYALFVVTLLRERGTDLTGAAPGLLQVRKLLHARLVAAMVHDGSVLDPAVVTAAASYLVKVATEKTTGIPDALRRGTWWRYDDCVLAAKALTLIDKDQGLELLFTLAADPAVPSFSVFDVLGELMVREDLSEIDSAHGLSVLYRIASVPNAAGVTQVEDSFNRMVIVDLMLDRDPRLGADLLRALARDSSMDLLDRYQCIERLVGFDRENAVDALIGIITDARNSLQSVLYTYPMLDALEPFAAVTALARAAADRTRGGYFRAVAGMVLYRDSPAEGAGVFQALAADPSVSGFHRVYHYAGSGNAGARASRLLALSQDPALPARWRVFAAEELWEDDHVAGIAALRAIRHDASAGGRTRVAVAGRMFVLNRARELPARLSERWKPLARLAEAAAVRPGDTIPMAVARYLLPYERVESVQRAHPAALLGAFTMLLGGIVAAAAVAAVFPGGVVPYLVWLAVLVLAANAVRSVLNWSMAFMTLTSQRLLVLTGIVVRKTRMVPKGAGGTDRYVKRSLLGRIFGYGTLVFKGSRNAEIMRVKYAADPARLYRDVLAVTPARSRKPRPEP